MKTVLKVLGGLLLILVIILLNTVGVWAQDDYVISNFKSNLSVNKDSSISVTEQIDVDFRVPKHGIFRIIPTSYSARGKTVRTNFNIIGVTDEQGVSYRYSIDRGGGSVKIKIGDADRTIIGKHTYVISYNIYSVVQRYEDYDEVYWNVTGSAWDVAIVNASAKIESPYAKIVNTECFAGVMGTNPINCRIHAGENSTDYTSEVVIQPGDDFTIVAALDKNGEIVFPGVLARSFKLIEDNWGYIFSLAPLIIIFYFWNRNGRDKSYKSDNIYYKPDEVSDKTVELFSRKHIPLVYHPIDGLSPSEAGTIIDEKVDIQDVVSEIIELARLGFLKIRKFEIEKIIGRETEYAFIKTDKFESEDRSKLKNYQDYLLRELFRRTIVHKSVSRAENIFAKSGDELKEAREKLVENKYVLLSSLKDHFYEGLPKFKEKLYDRMKDEGFFNENPEKVRKKWIILYLILSVIFFIGTINFAQNTANYGPLIFLIFASTGGLPFALSMPRRTSKGYSLFQQIRGLKWYLAKGKWRYDINEKHLFIEEILPLAVSLGVVNRLAKDMKGLEVEPPRYFDGTSWRGFSYDLGLFNKTAIASLVSAPGGKWSGASSWSGGSGFSGGSSGGGFGGGGGGSW